MRGDRERTVIRRIRLKDYRNYESSAIEFEPGINVVIAGNGRGKSNLLEALFFLLQGRSMRTSDERELVRNGEEEAVIEAAIRKGRDIKVRNVISREEGVKGKKPPKDITAVSFQPDDIWMVKGGPEARRRYLDEVIVETKAGYRETLREYQRALKQRNEALKAVRRGFKDREFIRNWNPLLYSKGRSIVEERKKTLADMSEEMAALGAKWGKEKVEMKYYTSMGEDITEEEKTMQKIKRMEEAEIRRGTTLVGPHRDELLFFLEGKNVRRECSQGEQKLVTIMWRITQAKLNEVVTGRKTIMLMDDCLSELDDKNRCIVLNELAGWEQVLLTTTDDSPELDGTHKIWLDGGE